MILIDRIVPIPDRTILLYCIDTELNVDYAITHEACTVMKDGKVLGLFPMKLMVIDYDLGYVEFIDPYDDAWFFSETFRIVHGLPQGYLYDRPYTGKRFD